ncbi:DUF2066 domain-containing protein [Halopseudomonas pelagia]|uniref:DUF2066 domain-containing protein n=1 Tax=Halopseudomonas pelagia TaxID=553151 RepID=UPI0030D8B00E|tara:strand:- start:73028 stop:74164 length:1137 start_codon:yes stop_codon:yes gene_type:complete
MYSTRKLLLLLALLLPAAVAQAAVVQGFYRVELPVAEGQARDEVMREALEVMLTRLGGADALSQRGRFDQALADPRSLMQRIGSVEDGGIEVEFEPAQLRELMSAARQSMLGPTRPGVMLWAVEQGALGDEFLASSSSWADTLNQAARHRAVALSFPLSDLQDRAAVNEEAIVSADQATLVKATERYEATAALALHITEQSAGWKLDWNLWLDGEGGKGSISAETREQAADELMLRVANQVFSQYAVPAASADGLNNWVIVVDNVEGLDAFAGLQRILQQLGSQVAPQLLAINGSQVRLKFDFSGSEAQLERLLALDQRLIRSQPPAPEPVVAAASPAALDEPLVLEPGITEGPAPEMPAPVEPVAEPAANTLYFRWR